MLIVKGGISRNINEKNLQSYLDKGYKQAEQCAKKQDDKIPVAKGIGKMTTAELEEKAFEIGIDISECKNNAERAEKIQQAIDAIQEGGE